jgi:hypothetical protein
VFVSLLNSVFALTAQPDAIQFQFAMSSRILSENFEITPYSYQIDDISLYKSIISNPNSLTSFIAQRIRDICTGQKRGSDVCDTASQNLLHVPVMRLTSNAASEHFSNWIYSLDGDNWYQFYPMRDVVDNYLNTQNHELVFFPSFRPEGVLVNDLSAEGQAVVFNHSTQSITLWTINLRD